MSDKGQTDSTGWDMGLFRWILWPRRSKDEEEDEPRRKGRKRGHAQPPAYRIEVDGEARQLRGEAPPFSFWSSSRIILILAFLLWWIQPAGPMIAGYVGGRRAGSSSKAVLAALMPVIAIFLANASYARLFAAHPADFVASLPDAVGGGAASILPFLAPYRDFMVAYLRSFVSALQSTFGMGTNGYLMVILFAYIGGIIGEQTRRELYYKSGASQTVGLNLIQPMFGRHPMAAEAVDEEDEELEEMRRPARSRARTAAVGQRGRHRRAVESFDRYRKVSAETDEEEGRHRSTRVRARPYDDDEEEDEAPARGHHPARVHAEERHARARAEPANDEEDAEAVDRREAKEARKPSRRSHEEEVAIQRFVERALRNYDHTKL